MQFTPQESFENIRESLAQYLETQYKLAHPILYRERGELLRVQKAIAQTPFVESTPSFLTSRKLSELERAHPHLLPPGLAELVTFGVKVNKNDLYEHQERALLSAYDPSSPNLLVATGTGSGKTEAFLLPILSDILREARSWSRPRTTARRGAVDPKTNHWLHSRRHETRPAAIRSIILYPMNALVNDQLARLRRILALGDSPGWQQANLQANNIHFGMYTSATPCAGSWVDQWRQKNVEQYLSDLEDEWTRLAPRPDLQGTGSWPRPDSPEMLLRWDMQQAPPDILVTNYSMLEYMLVRPIENGIFNKTRQWLASDPSARFTLVLDEAHTYSGAKGTEVAHLVRRLKERLGIESAKRSFRAIATSASVPQDRDGELKQFAGDLFGEPAQSFTLIHAQTRPARSDTRAVTQSSLAAWTRFQQKFTIADPLPAMKALATDFDLGEVPSSSKPEAAMYELLETEPFVEWTRNRTARKATPLDTLADECWNDVGTADDRQKAIAGILAAGSFARKDGDETSPPLLSMRQHSFFRGIAGIWACIDSNCSLCDEGTRIERPVGKLYLEPRPWCDCGARVLEVFTCHYCGLTYLAGIPDAAAQSLWPWADDLSNSGRPDSTQFFPFGVEQPDNHSSTSTSPTYRSTRTTEICSADAPYARPVWEVHDPVDPNPANGQRPNHFPKSCPRCCHWRNAHRDREVVENLRTKGVQSFATILEEAFRFQPRSSKLQPNYGRKALVFSDSRAQASKLAQELKDNHAGDVFRQVLYRVLHECQSCKGRGTAFQKTGVSFKNPGQNAQAVSCAACKGTGVAEHPSPKSYEELKRRVIELEVSRGIDPTRQRIGHFFDRYGQMEAGIQLATVRYFDAALRREVSEEQFALEPLALGKWRVPIFLNGNEIELTNDAEAFDHLTATESNLLVQSVVRLLATMDVITAPQPNAPWDWSKTPDGRLLVEHYETNTLIRGIWGDKDWTGKKIPFAFTENYPLGRYVAAIARKLAKKGVFSTEQDQTSWVENINSTMWDFLKAGEVITPAGQKFERPGRIPQTPRGIALSRFVLHPIAETVNECTACKYIMADVLMNICLRCGQETEPIQSTEVPSYFRRAALFAKPGSGVDDPYPIRASEHTAQISSKEARDEERWFQDQFLDDQNDLDRRVDVLSVTTTMEMGIDIGSLLFVGLRNVPPTVANYQQRAGRAGRRGSALATVVTFAQPRNHDQYYFDRPPEIVSDPPQVPALHLDNPVIAQRHVRALALQFFFSSRAGISGGNLFASWGTVQDFVLDQTASKLADFVSFQRITLRERCEKIVDPSLSASVPVWLSTLSAEVAKSVEAKEPGTLLFEGLIRDGFLPRYAFPIDVVSLTIPAVHASSDQADAAEGSDDLQRDLKIAIAEYAPGADTVRQTDQVTYKYRSVALNDPFERTQSYTPTGILVECSNCKSADLITSGQNPPDSCQVCGLTNLTIRPYIRPRGFTVDGALPDGGREIYESVTGTDRSGSSSPARLQVGQFASAQGKPHTIYGHRLITDIHVGQLIVTNTGAIDAGFVLCPVCGRAVDPEDTAPHRRPANVPPHFGYKKQGPRAGSMCPAKAPWKNELILAFSFASEILLIGVDLPSDLDASFATPAGQSIWYSLGTLIANAATKVLQIDPGELKVGARPFKAKDGRILGEIFIYDDVPGGAGYARRLLNRLDEVLYKAMNLGEHCSDPNCTVACYRCMFDYRNQALHSKLDRRLATDLLRFVMEGSYPVEDPNEVANALNSFCEYARAHFEIEPGYQTADVSIPVVLKGSNGQRFALWPIHPLRAKPNEAIRQSVAELAGGNNVRCAVHNLFDIGRRPLWVLDHLGDA